MNLVWWLLAAAGAPSRTDATLTVLASRSSPGEFLQALEARAPRP